MTTSGSHRLVSTMKSANKQKYRAICACGWISKSWPSEEAAEDEHQDHEVYMTSVAS